MERKLIIWIGIIGLFWIGLARADEKTAESSSAPSLKEPVPIVEECHSEPFGSHPERSEASPSPLPQGKLREESKLDPAEIEKGIKQIKEELGKDYLVAYQEPFIIAGNTSRRLFDRIKDGTIKRCSQALYQDFFKQKPDYPIKVYLFKNAKSYEAYCQKTFGQEPSTPFGFYNHAGKELIMDISTGTGTLVHEMVHALICPDFPDVPAWFNEGLGSLYEQCQIETNGSLRGLINWRYPRLKKAILVNKLVKLKDLLAMDENTFYGENSDLHYAEARYFCMYLQEKKVLPEFYKAFRHNYYLKDRPKKRDCTGLKTITKILKQPIDKIEINWINWVKNLKQE